jgi:hypothetical protein
VVLPQDAAKASARRAEVESLLDKGAIVHIDNPGPGFYSHIFVVPKKQKGSLRLIIDLSRLNRFLRVPHFKMETPRSIAAAMLPGDWAASLDLQDTYLHVHVHPDYQRYLRFYFEGRACQFKAMPFGLAFLSIVKAFVAPLHALGLKLHFYLDDWFLRNASKDILKTQMKLLIKNVKLARWIRNEKSDLDSLPGLHIHQDSLLHPCGTNVPSGQDCQDIVQSQAAVHSKVLSGKGILKSHWPTKLSGRSSPIQEVVSSTSSTSPALQMETTPGPSGSGNSPSRILTKRSLEILGVRDSSQSGGVVTSTPSQTLHIH